MQALVEEGAVVIEAVEQPRSGEAPLVDRVAESRDEGEEDSQDEMPRQPAPGGINPPPSDTRDINAVLAGLQVQRDQPQPNASGQG
jgi:hypothetical protein